MCGVIVGRREAVSVPRCLRCFLPTRDGGAGGSNFFSFLDLSSGLLELLPGRLRPPPGVP